MRSERGFHRAVMAVAVGFTMFFGIVVVPALIDDPNVIDAFGDGFVNPFSSGYSIDVIACWVVLALWVWRDRRVHAVRHGGWCLVVGIVPGVVVGFAAYLVVRSQQVDEHASSER